MQDDSSYTILINETDDTTYLRDLISMNSKMTFHEVYSIEEMASMMKLFSEDWEDILKKNLPASELNELGENFFKEKRNVLSVLKVAEPN